jgi:hypothetical protein
MASLFRLLFLSKVGKRNEDKQLCVVSAPGEQRPKLPSKQGKGQNMRYETKQLDILERFVKETNKEK